MRIPFPELDASPEVYSDWWSKHVEYSKFRRQGIDIVCATFQHSSPPKANVVVLTGMGECFLKYSEVIEQLYRDGFNVFTYDHQSQGLSGRWQRETQSVWVHSFDDYVDDLVYFVHTITQQEPTVRAVPTFLLAHSMGGFIASIAMSRIPNLFNRAVLCAPMLRMHCGMRWNDWQTPLPQPLTYWFAKLNRYLGLGSMHTLGFFKEKPNDKIKLNIYTSDEKQQNQWIALRTKYPSIMAMCVTNDWVYHSLRAQRRFAERYRFIQTDTLIFSAETDYLVNNRALAMFVRACPCAKMFRFPGAFHEIFFEKDTLRHAAIAVALNFFNQRSDSVQEVAGVHPMEEHDYRNPIYTWSELLLRSVGVAASIAGVVAGVAMLLSGRRTKGVTL